MDPATSPRVLMVAYHFPPLRGSSGIQRTLRFCRYLPEFGWRPVVLTVNSRAYEDIGDDLMGEVPVDMPLKRAFALDAARHLSFRGRYPRIFADPDRWVSWLLAGTILGLSLIGRYRARAIFSTFPIATAHLIGLVLHRITGLPWVADFRDPMAQAGYPVDPTIWRHFRWIEEQALRRAARSLFTSPGAIRDYRSRYPDIPPERFLLVENGYDEEAFAGLQPGPARTDLSGVRRLVLLHSGIVYALERDPTMLFRALGALKRAGTISASELELRFRASANESLLRSLAQEYDVADLVTLAPQTSYRTALQEMVDADALVLMQAANCNSQTPAKAYEYLRAGRPILALTDALGDTAGLLHRAGLAPLGPLDSTEAIAAALPQFIHQLRTNSAATAPRSFVDQCSRRECTRVLASVFDDLKK